MENNENGNEEDKTPSESNQYIDMTLKKSNHCIHVEDTPTPYLNQRYLKSNQRKSNADKQSEKSKIVVIPNTPSVRFSLMNQTNSARKVCQCLSSFIFYWNSSINSLLNKKMRKLLNQNNLNEDEDLPGDEPTKSPLQLNKNVSNLFKPANLINKTQLNISNELIGNYSNTALF